MTFEIFVTKKKVGAVLSPTPFRKSFKFQIKVFSFRGKQLFRSKSNMLECDKNKSLKIPLHYRWD